MKTAAPLPPALGVSAVADPARLAAVAATGLVEHPESPVLDRITALAVRLVGGEASLVSLVGDERQHIVSRSGPGAAGVPATTPLSHSYCQYVVETDESLVIADARKHPCLSDHPAIGEYQAIAYLGVPLRSPDGQVLGTLCAVDTEERPWSDADVAVMEDLSAAATAEMAARIAGHRRRRPPTGSSRSSAAPSTRSSPPIPAA